MKVFASIAAAVLAAGAITTTAAATTLVFKGDGNNVTPTGALGVDYVACASAAALQDYCSNSANPNGGHGAGLTFMLDGIEVNVVAFAPSGATRLIQDRDPGDSGLGAWSENTIRDDQTQFDAGESILFDFTKEGRNFAITDIEFNAGIDRNCSDYSATLPDEGPCGEFRLQVWDIGGASVLDTIVNIDTMTSIIGGQDILPGFGAAGAKFLLTALTDGGGFAVAQFTVNEVPIPGAAVLLLSGLAGLGFATRRKNKSL